jgi:hypothetical protein
MKDIVYSVGQGACSLFELSGGEGICPTQAGTILMGYVVFGGLAAALIIAAVKLRT